MNYKDIKELNLEEKQNHFNNIYGHKLKYVGNKYHIVERILSLNKNSKPNPEKLAVIDGIFSLNLARKYNIGVKYLIICLEKIHSIEAQEIIDNFMPKKLKGKPDKKQLEGIKKELDSCYVCDRIEWDMRHFMATIFVEWAKSKKADKYVIGVLKDNARARKVYESWSGKLSEYEHDFVVMNVGYPENFYTFEI